MRPRSPRGVLNPVLGPLGLLCVVWSGCAVENSIKDGDTPGTDTGDSASDSASDTGDSAMDTGDSAMDTGDSAAPEECNGLDDDGDGTIDEGYPDEDVNGRADCLDTPCPSLDVGAPGAVAIVGACLDAAPTPVASPWSVRELWRFQAPAADPTAQHSYVAPVVGNLDDDNGDGIINQDDVPDVIVNVTGSTTWIVALDGATGDEKWAWSGASYWGSIAIADIDGDGVPEVLAYDQSAVPTALTATGGVLWRAAGPTHAAVPQISVADLDEDGVPEVIADALVLDGPTGALEVTLGIAPEAQHRMVAVADADLDGTQEIYAAGDAWNADGSLLWESGEGGPFGFWPVVVQADADPEAEIGFVGNQWSLFDTDGAPLAAVAYGSPAQPGPPCAGDFDGDGATEVAWSSAGTLFLYELDGTLVWSVGVDDTQGYAGCSGFDMDGDGALEILFAGESSFLVFDGATGSQRVVDTGHRSVTLFEYPTVADVDHDGAAEILVVSNGATGGALVVYEHAGAGWPPAGPTWATHDFTVATVDPDGSVPSTPEPFWTTYGVYRARPALDTVARPDLYVTVTDTCLMDCTYGPVALAVQVGNHGAVDIPAGATLDVTADDGGTTRLVATVLLPAVPAGTEAAGFEIPLDVTDIGTAGWIVTVDASGLGVPGECDRTNNEVIVATPCP